MTFRTLENVSSSSDDWDWRALRARCLEITRRVLSPADAEDAAQEALLRAWRIANREAIRDRAAWMAVIARHEALRLVARESVLAGRHADLEVDLIAAAGWEHELHDRLDLVSALGSLPLPERIVLHLRYLEDQTQMALAHRLGIPEGTAKVRLHRARKRLAREFRKGTP